MGKKYKCLFFDFDRTIWDVEENQKQAVCDIYGKYGLSMLEPEFETFYAAYHAINDRLWLDYRDGRVPREYLRNHRFVELLARFGCGDPALARTISDEYMAVAPFYNRTIPGAVETVKTLSEEYPIYLVTNGFNEVQALKVRNCGLEEFIREIVTSEDAGANKPDPRIFRYALRRAGVANEETVMIGDDPEADIEGAVRSGIDTVFFNPHRTVHTLRPTHEIGSITELLPLLSNSN